MSKLETFKRHTYTPNSFYDYLVQYEKAMKGDTDLLVPTPAIANAVLANINADGLLVVIEAELQSADGKVHEWFNGELTATVATSGDGVVVNPDTDLAWSVLDFVEGKATMKLQLLDAVAGATWVAGETVTVTLANGKTLLGSPALTLAKVVLTIASGT